jgi:hypothetical protein
MQDNGFGQVKHPAGDGAHHDLVVRELRLERVQRGPYRQRISGHRRHLTTSGAALRGVRGMLVFMA